MRSAKLFLYSFQFIIITLFIGCIVFYFTSYDQIINYFIQSLDRPDLEQKLSSQFFTIAKFHTLKNTVWIGALFLLGLFVFTYFTRKKLLELIQAYFFYLKNIRKNFFNEIQHSKKINKILLFTFLGLVLARSVFCALYFKANYDECWNYNYFLSGPFFNSIVAYNNYPLHNLITWIFVKLLPDSTFTLRLSVIIMGLFMLLTAFVLFKKIFKNEKYGLWFIILMACAPMNVFYMLYARGVIFAVFFALCLFYFLFGKKINTWSKHDTFSVVLLVVLGSYSMLSFPVYVFYSFLVTFLLLSKKNYYAAAIKLFWVAGLSFGMLLCLFLPMLLGSGMHLMTENGYTHATFNWERWFYLFQTFSVFETGSRNGIILLFIINIFLLLHYWKSAFRTMLIFSLVLISMPLHFAFFTGIILPPRTLAFNTIAIAIILFFLAICITQVFKNKFGYSINNLLFFIMALSIYYNSYWWVFDKKDNAAYTMASALQNKNITQLHISAHEGSYFVPILIYYYKLQNKKVNISSNREKSTRYLQFAESEAEAFICDVQKQIPNTTEAFRNDEVKLLLKK